MDYSKVQIDLLKARYKEMTGGNLARILITEPFMYEGTEYTMFSDGFRGVWVPTTCILVDAGALTKNRPVMKSLFNIDDLDFKTDKLQPRECREVFNSKGKSLGMEQYFYKLSVDNDRYYSVVNLKLITQWFGKLNELQFYQSNPLGPIWIYEYNVPLGLVLPIRHSDAE